MLIAFSHLDGPKQPSGGPQIPKGVFDRCEQTLSIGNVTAACLQVGNEFLVLHEEPELLRDIAVEVLKFCICCHFLLNPCLPPVRHR
jgi:hypothetical protein